MSRKKIILSILLIVVVAGGFYAYKEYTRTNKSLTKVSADHTTSATGIINEFEKNDSASTNKYLGKIIEVTGNIKNVEKDDNDYYTVVLGDSSLLTSVRCAIDSNNNNKISALKNESLITIRGACTGFNKDDMGLGSDIILNRCVVIDK